MPAVPFRCAAASQTLTASVLAFFMVTLDAVIVNIALPTIRAGVGGGMTGSQWVADSYTLTFAALLLSGGALADRIGARRALRAGLTVFAVASCACVLAPDLTVLVSARFVQGAAAAVMMPSSMALVSQAYQEPARKARALAVWSMGAALATSAGPLLGGVLTLVSWRLIFVINVPAAAVALCLLARTPRSPRRDVPFDWCGQVTGVLAMAGLTYGAIEAGSQGLGAPTVIVAVVVAAAALGAFVTIEARGRHPMMPLGLFRSRTMSVSVAVGFAFVVGFYGLPFVMSLYLQEVRGLSPLAAGIAFLPMMLTGAALTPFGARFAECLSARVVIAAGLGAMAVGLTVLSTIVLTPSPVWILSAVMILTGLAGATVTSPMTGLLLNAVPQHQAGTAGGVFNTSRQVGGALAVAVFGALLARHSSFMQGMRVSLLIAAAIALAASAMCVLLQRAVVGRHALGRPIPPAPVPVSAPVPGPVPVPVPLPAPACAPESAAVIIPDPPAPQRPAADLAAPEQSDADPSARGESAADLSALEQSPVYLSMLEQCAADLPALEQPPVYLSTLAESDADLPALEQPPVYLSMLEQTAPELPAPGQSDASLAALEKPAAGLPAVEQSAADLPAPEQAVAELPAPELSAADVPAAVSVQVVLIPVQAGPASAEEPSAEEFAARGGPGGRLPG